MTGEPRQLRDIIVVAIAKAAEMDAEALNDDINLLDIGLDSLDLAGILIDIEDAAGSEIPAEMLDRFLDAGDVVTIGSVVSLLSSWDTTRGLPQPFDDVIVVQEI